MHVDADGNAVPCDKKSRGPPIVVMARLTGPSDGDYFKEDGLRVRLLLDEHYPASPPTVHFMQTVHHFFLGNENDLPTIFYELLTDLVSELDASNARGAMVSGACCLCCALVVA